MDLSNDFSNTQIDNKNCHLKNCQDTGECEEGIDERRKYKDSLGGKDIVQLKGNHITRSLIPLEKLFNQNYVDKDPNMKPTNDAFEDKNIGTKDHLKIIKLSKKMPAKVKEDCFLI